MRAFIGIVATDRPKVLEACLRHLLSFDQHGIFVHGHADIWICDNSVQDTIEPIAKSLVSEGWPVHYCRISGGHDGSVDAAETELGRSRRWLVDRFMLASEYSDCVLLDDDMLVTADTIGEAIQDLAMLRDLGVGCLSLHPFKKRFQQFTYEVGERKFISFDYSGDSSWIIPRDILAQTGNCFRPSKSGYANSQFAAIRDIGRTPATALTPCYEIQHVGVDELEGTRIHKKATRKPGWTKVLFSDYLTGRVLYSNIVMTWKLGGVDHVIGALRKGMEGMLKTKRDESARDRFPRARGRVEIQIENVKTGEVERTINIGNLIVDNAKNVMAHLLGGAASAEYAITKMTFGTGSTAPTENDTGIEIPVTPTKAVTVDYPDSGSVRFTSVLESDEANGFPIHEAGLYSAGQGVIARVVFGPLTKSNDFRFVFRWTVYW
jgi:hypothetical protein